VRRLRVVVGAGLLALAVATALQPGDVVAQSGAASIVEAGWWSRQPTGTPGNAFEVARAPDGDLSVAAFRIRIDGSVTTARLRLEEAGQAAGSPSLQVCATTAPWTPAAPGPWEQRPAPTCGATPVRLVHDEVQRAYTADMAGFLTGGQGATVSVMVVPAPDESVTVPPPLPPPPADVPVAPPVTPPPPSTIPATTPVPLPFTIGFAAADLQAPGGAPASPSGDLGSSPSFEPTGDLVGDDSFFATPDIPAPSEQAISAPAQAEGRFPTRRTAGRVDGEGVDQPWERTPLLALAAAAIGAATTFGRRRLRDLGWLGAS
jgi:hypothetical protein